MLRPSSPGDVSAYNHWTLDGSYSLYVVGKRKTPTKNSPQLSNPLTELLSLILLFTHSCNWALLEKLPIAQPLKKFSAFYGIIIISSSSSSSSSRRRRTNGNSSSNITISIK
jgi:hypothetical protein